MASAGKILITPKGNWNAETEYKILDLVKHNGTSWLSKKNVSGVEPTTDNSEYWQDVFDSSAFINSLDARIEAKIQEYITNHSAT